MGLGICKPVKLDRGYVALSVGVVHLDWDWICSIVLCSRGGGGYGAFLRKVAEQSCVA